MSHSKRKADVIEPEVEKDELTKEKHSKIDSTTNDFLRLNDTNFIETDYQIVFQTIADKLINSYELVLNEQHFFRLSEIEFYFYHHIRHPDTFAHRHPEQQYHSNWYFHRQGTSPTASYKAGTYKGLDLTFNSLNDLSYGGILIRSIENKQTGQIYEGSCLVVDGILNLCNSKTINELVENKLNKNLNIFNKNSFIYLRTISIITNQKLISSPRVGLTLKNSSIDRERFLFRSYRFTSNNYYPTKMKFMILLSLAGEKFFQNKNKKFIDYAKDLSIETNIRLSTVMNNLNELQNGYDTNISNKTSPLVDYYKKTFKTSDLIKAYGIWLRNYR
ncbi:unnamed protein product [Rotaria sp. Silwood1]|nr:unnamed protein product [Rotaria sp. Silwood1]CAF1572087.1 unnamed protein product [Rotaria sp. Silwood1]CAF3672008.1 unnamed protein product [Rotaria sp. Silwood1]CAF3718577.1 unnamed protein product [Rotaria sp. Silwood1]CAF4831960.1 unnamed protein product [Rotaria sp. Silwood1]